MALELRQQLKLSQQLVMTPQLQQAIKLLQLSRLELVESIQQELMENPLLEEVQEEDKPERVMAEEEHGPLPGGDNTAIERELIKNAEWDDYLGDFASTPVQSHIRETEIPERAWPSMPGCPPSPPWKAIWIGRCACRTSPNGSCPSARPSAAASIPRDTFRPRPRNWPA